MRQRLTIFTVFAVFVAGISLGALLTVGRDGTGVVLASAQAQPAPQRSPVGTVPDRDIYYPGTEPLDPDEMRITALGTGMPSSRPKQAAACFLVELGNGDKFLFDIGSG